jgi:ABC-type uncharacterized transport system substrate-binding protein
VLKFLITILLLAAVAHPCALCKGVSAFANTATVTQISDSELVKINISWTFDEASSLAMLNTYDKNRDKVFDENEIKVIYDALSKLQEPKFMTVLMVDSKEFKNYNIQNFKVKNQNKLVTVSFDLVLNYKLKPNNVVELYFLDWQGTLVFLQKPDMATVQNFGSYKVKKTNTFRVSRENMSVANALILEISK